MIAEDFVNELNKHANKNYAMSLQRYFKTGKGEYGEGDTFIGVRVPNIRKVCKQFKTLPISEVKKLLESNVHEYRMAAVIILCNQYKKADEKFRKQIYDLYILELENNKINNWDIVDVSAGRIVGEYNRFSNRKILYQLAKSKSLWARRVAIMSTSVYIMTGEANSTIDLSTILLNDKHDLIHKAVGWMLREVGSRVDEKILTDFLEKNVADMPRVMLRYACEKLSKNQRDYFYKK